MHFQPPQRQRFRHVRTVGYLRSPYQRGGMFLGPDPFDRDPTRFSPWMERQLGGALYRRRPTLTDKIAEGVAMGLSGPSPSDVGQLMLDHGFGRTPVFSRATRRFSL